MIYLKVFHDSTENVMRDFGGPICPPSHPLKFSSSASFHSFEKENLEKEDISKDVLLEHIPFLLSRLGLSQEQIEEIEKLNKNTNEEINNGGELQHNEQENDVYASRQSNIRLVSKEMPGLFNKDFKHDSESEFR